MMEFVSWDDDIPNMMGKSLKKCSSHHQPAINSGMFTIYELVHVPFFLDVDDDLTLDDEMSRSYRNY